MKKRFLSMLMALIMVIGLLPMAAFAEESTSVPEDRQLSALCFRSGMLATSAEYELIPEFSPELKEYTVIVPDSDSAASFAVWATLSETAAGKQIAIAYTNATSNRATSIKLTSGNASGVRLTGAFKKNSFAGNVLTVKVGDEEAYTVNVSRRATINSLDIKNENGGIVELSPAFSGGNVCNYTSAVEKGSVLYVTPTASVSGAQISVAGNAVASGETVQVTPVWDEHKTFELEVSVSGEGAETTSYKIKYDQKFIFVEADEYGEEKAVEVTEGDPVPAINVRVDAEDVKIQWQESTDEVTFTDIEGANEGEFTPPSEAGITYYRAIITHADGTATVGTYKVTVNLAGAKDYYGKGNEGILWPGTYNLNEYNNNAVDVSMPKPESAKIAWQTEERVGNGSMAVVGDYVYMHDAYTGGSMGSIGLGGYSKKLVKIDKYTGEIVDSLELSLDGQYYYSYIIYADGTIYVSATNGVSAVDVATFTEKWTTLFVNGSYSTIMQHNGYLYASGTILDADNGKIIKKLEGSFKWANGPFVENSEGKDILYMPGVDGKIVAIDSSTMEIIDSFTFKTSDTTTGLQAGAAFSEEESRLYWHDAIVAKIYSIVINSDGTFDENSFIEKTPTSGITTTCTPVVFNGRVYFAGQKGGAAAQGGYIEVCDSETLETIYVTNKIGAKIQSTPILSYAEFEETGKIYIYVQEYSAPGSVYVLEDSADATSGNLVLLVEPEAGNYAWEQLAVDSDGALYFTNDTGLVMKVVDDEIEALINDKCAAKAVEELISAIGNITLDSEEAIEAARNAYNALTEDQKSIVGNYDVLAAAERTLAMLKNRDTVTIVIGSKDYTEADGEVNPETGAPVLNLGVLAVLCGTAVLAKFNRQ